MLDRKPSFLGPKEYMGTQLWIIDMLFTDLKNYQELIERFLLQEKQKLEQEFEKTDLELEAKKAGEHHREFYSHLLDSYSERHHEISGLFPHHFRCFFLTQAISVIESELKKICDYYGRVYHQKFTVDDLKGSDDLQRCKEYLAGIKPINFFEFNNEWQFIKDCKKLRNKIVHQDGKIKPEDKQLVQFIDRHPAISRIDYPSEELIEFTIDSNQLALDLIKNAVAFFEKLMEKLWTEKT